MDKHTAEPWRVTRPSYANYTHISSEHLERIAVVSTDVDARRIVAAVNACAGIPTEHLEQCGKDFLGQYTEMKSVEKLVEQRDKLLEALKDMVSDRDCLDDETISFARAAIAKVEGEKA